MLTRMLIIGSLAVLAVAQARPATATELNDFNTNIAHASVAGASALASADFGVLRLQDDATGIAGGYNPQGISRSRWEDVLTVVPSDVSLLGTTGT